MKEFKSGQQVIIVAPAEMMGLQVKGAMLVPARVVNQTGKGDYNVVLTESNGNRIIANVSNDTIHANIKEASTQQSEFIMAMLEEESNLLRKDAIVSGNHVASPFKEE